MKDHSKLPILTFPRNKKLPPGKRLLNVPEAAEYLSLAEQTIRNWASMGKLPKVQAYGALRFDIQALDQWIENRSGPSKL